MAVYVNVAVREHEERRVSYERAHGAEYTEATGYKEVLKYTGRWQDMCEMARSECAAPVDAWQVSCEVERGGGDMAELTLTRVQYEAAEGEGGEEKEVGTQDNPAYSSSFTVQAEPLLCHPYFMGVSTADMELLKELESGASAFSIVNYKGTDMQLRVALSQLSGTAKEAKDYYLRGVTQYYEVYADATARWKGGGRGAFTVGKICTPPGNPPTPAGRTWLCVGFGIEKQGDEVWYSATFRLSGAGGWDTKLYGN